MNVGAQILYQFAIIITAGAAAALLMRRLGVPTIVGYLLAGALVGPYGLGLARETASLTLLAQVGVALLMFALGVELSLSQLSAAARAAWIAAPLQIGLSVLVGIGVGAALGWIPAERVLLGFALALSSTILIVKVVGDAGKLSTLQGQALIAVSLVQDLAAVVMVALVPALGQLSAGTSQLPMLAVVLLKGIVFVGVVWAVARWVVPPLMQTIANAFSREVFLAAVTALSLLGAIAAELLGFSLALGAFLAGLALSESPYNHEVLAEVLPLRDVFGILFFVTLGTLLDLGFVASHLRQVALIAALALVGKPLLALVGFSVAGYHLGVGLPAALGLGQLGEFSFVIVSAALGQHIVGGSFYSLVMAAAALTILLSPLLYSLGPVLAGGLAGLVRMRELPVSVMPALFAHFIIIGYGRVGQHIGDAARAVGIPILVVDLNPELVAELQREQVPALYGDAASAKLLEQALPERATAAAVCLPDAHSSVLAVRYLRRANPNLHIVARAHTASEVDLLYAAGADHVIQAEFEAGLEMTRESLIHMGHPAAQVQEMVDRMRVARYGTFTEQGEYPLPGEAEGAEES